MLLPKLSGNRSSHHPERFRARHWEGYRTVMSTGVTRYGQELLAVPAIRKDGQRISIEFSITLRRDADGALVGAAASIRCDGAVGTRARRPDPACASHNRSHPAWSGLSLVDRPIQGGTA